MAKKAAELSKMPEDVLFKSPKEILEIARKFIGVETEPVPGRYPVEYDPIRRYCHMTLDTNPLFLDPQYAKKTKYKAVVCPPLLVGNFASSGVWPPGGAVTSTGLPTLPIRAPGSGRMSINMATEWEFFKPVKVGDILSQKNRVGDVYMKAIKRDPEAIWTVTERIITNQDGEVVAIARTSNVGWKEEQKSEASK